MKNTTLLLLITSLLTPSEMRGDEPGIATKGHTEVFPRGEPSKLGINVGALENLRKRGEESKSDAIVIIKDGQLVADWDFGHERGPIEAMSATKSIVSLAIGRLIDAGKIKSLDQPVCDFYPEWKQGRKRSITIRHLLNHTSGIQNLRTTTPEIYPSPDFVQLALAAELSDGPGKRFDYNNKAVNLLAGVVQRASGIRMDLYLGKELFEPLGIKDFGWTLDPSGNPHGMSGLQIRAIDLAKIGQMMLDEGSWKGKQILSKDWVHKSIEPSQEIYRSYGLLWWLHFDGERLTVDDALIQYLKQYGMTPATTTKMEELKGRGLDPKSFWGTLRPIIQGDDVLRTKLADLNKNIPQPKLIVEGPIRSFEAQGYLGQYLVVSPRDRIVAVRQRRGPGREDSPEEFKRSFSDFANIVAGLASKPPATP